MASLDQSTKKAWKAALSSNPAPWVICGIRNDQTGSVAKLDGIPGLIDWIVHGQVSRRLQQGQLGPKDCCLVPGAPERKLPHFLFFPTTITSQAFAEKVKHLKISELALAETTFPEDFLPKVKQTLKKEGIRCVKLEP